MHIDRLVALFLSALPSVHTLVIVLPIALAYCIAISRLVGYLRCTRNVRTAYTRKIFHFGIFTMTTIVHLVWALPGVTVVGTVVSAIVLYAVMRGEGFPLYEALARPSDAPRRTMFIIVPLLTTIFGGIFTNSFFPRFAYIGYLVCGWGDAVGEPIGSRFGKHVYSVPSLSGVRAKRSLEGSLAVFLVGSIAATLGFFAYGETPPHPILRGLACGLAGALVEAVSNHGVDNFTTQVAAAATATVLGS